MTGGETARSAPPTDEVRETIASVLGVAAVRLTDSSSPETIQAWDSLNHLNLVIALERKFGVKFVINDVLEMRSVGAIRSVLDQAIQSAKSELAFLECQQEHLPALEEMIRRSYGSQYILYRDPVFLRWQYSQSSRSASSKFNLRLATVNGAVAGCLGYIPTDVAVGGQLMSGAWLANWMIDPDKRSVGLGPMLVRNVSQDFPITLALGANREARELLVRMGWTDLGALDRHVQVLDADRASQLTVDGRLSWPAAERSGRGRLPAKVQSRLVDRLGEEAEQLWAAHWETYESAAGARRSCQFLQWRYTRHPHFRYRMFEIRRAGELVGFAVYRVENVRDLPVRVGRICELVVRPGTESWALHAITQDARAQQVAAVDFFTASDRFAQALKDSGFLPGDDPAAAKIPLLYQPIDRRKTEIAWLADLQQVPPTKRITDWYVTTADGDQDRPT